MVLQMRRTDNWKRSARVMAGTGKQGMTEGRRGVEARRLSRGEGRPVEPAARRLPGGSSYFTSSRETGRFSLAEIRTASRTRWVL